MKDNQVQEINETEFKAQVLASQMPALVGFVAGWSQACGRMEPVLQEVAKACTGVAKVFKLDVDDNPDLGTEYGIQSVPMLIFFRDGAVRVKIVGTASAKAILAKLQLPQPNLVGETDPAKGLTDHKI
jgi:thioredoxin 1